MTEEKWQEEFKQDFLYHKFVSTDKPVELQAIDYFTNFISSLLEQQKQEIIKYILKDERRRIIEQIRSEERDRISKLIAEEMSIANKEGQPTSRLTSLAVKI